MAKKIGIIDAELATGLKRTFPNLVCMKISGYYKSLGYETELVDMSLINQMYKISNASSLGWKLKKLYSKIFVSKVFTETQIPQMLLSMEIVEYGGTGFYYSDAQPLPYEIEHCMPDYHLYDKWIEEQLKEGKNPSKFKYFNNASVGYATRHCVRHCSFCVNKNYNKVIRNSNIEEFLDKDRNYIALLDENSLGYENYKDVFKELNSTGKRFEFMQGMDIRMLDEERINTILTSNYEKNSLSFAFDNIEDKSIIIEKMKLWRKYYAKTTHMYVLCGYDKTNKYDDEFWIKDIQDTLYRIKVCMEYGFLPYLMRYNKYKLSPFRNLYVLLASWCNQHSVFIKMSIREFGYAMQKIAEKNLGGDITYSTLRYILEFEEQYPEIAKEYFDLKYEEFAKYQYKDNVGSYKDWFKKNADTVTFDKGITISYNNTNLNSIKRHSVDLIFYNMKDNIQDNDYINLDVCINSLNPSGAICLTFSNENDLPLIEKFFKERKMKIVKIGSFVDKGNLTGKYILVEVDYNSVKKRCLEIRNNHLNKIKKNKGTTEDKTEYNRYFNLLRKINKRKDTKVAYNIKDSCKDKYRFMYSVAKRKLQKNDLVISFYCRSKSIEKISKLLNVNFVCLTKRHTSYQNIEDTNIEQIKLEIS